MTAPSQVRSQVRAQVRTQNARYDRTLAGGLVLAAVATAVGAFWMITGPGSADAGRVATPVIASR